MQCVLQSVLRLYCGSNRRFLIGQTVLLMYFAPYEEREHILHLPNTNIKFIIKFFNDNTSVIVYQLTANQMSKNKSRMLLQTFIYIEYSITVFSFILTYT